MRKKAFFLSILSLIALLSLEVLQTRETCVGFTADPKKQRVQMFWKTPGGKRYGSIGNLKAHLEKSGQEPVYLSNAGMFALDRSPQGLYIENGKMLQPLDTSTASGNFYLKPNGVFYLTKNATAEICISQDFNAENVQFATQSGPMLLIDGKVHPAFKQGSTNVNIRNGVGILADGRILLAISKQKINFYDFADYFKKAGCKNALYLDGFVSRAYVPQAGLAQLDGDFGVMISVSE
ncbi:MAG: hypothetical protein EOO10_24640 [Chitinophagaceae bacterium]|nr:MAG: hypothetical protein EOO10_24640 [Chitinophagaceae bacterium]